LFIIPAMKQNPLILHFIRICFVFLPIEFTNYKRLQFLRQWCSFIVHIGRACVQHFGEPVHRSNQFIAISLIGSIKNASIRRSSC
jgi:hypothetical protein